MDTTVAPLASIGVDIGKEVFHLVGFGTDGKIAFRRKIKRLALTETFKKLAPCIVGMEACLSAHFVSRALASCHEPRDHPGDLRAVVKENNDYNDVEAIAEARCARTCEPCGTQTARSGPAIACGRVAPRRTATINQIRAFSSNRASP
jgi:transposase